MAYVDGHSGGDTDVVTDVADISDADLKELPAKRHRLFKKGLAATHAKRLYDLQRVFDEMPWRRRSAATVGSQPTLPLRRHVAKGVLGTILGTQSCTIGRSPAGTG